MSACMCDSPNVDLICGNATVSVAKSKPSEKQAAPSRNSKCRCAAVSPPAGTSVAGPATSSPTGQPVRDQPVRDRRGRRQARSPLLVAPDLVAGEPAHVLELVVGHVRLTGQDPRLEPEHQRGGERPRL